MSPIGELPAWAAWLTALCLLTGAGCTMLGSLGLLWLKNFYQRVHAPTLGTTLGAGGVLLGSMICFSVLGSRPVLHEILILVFITVTTPITLILLVRGVRYRDTDPDEAPESAADGNH